MPTKLPTYASLRVDPEGNVWAGRFESPGTMHAQEWDVFSHDGGYLGVVIMPEGLNVFEIGLDYVLGKWLDDSDVEFVRRYRLIRE